MEILRVSDLDGRSFFEFHGSFVFCPNLRSSQVEHDRFGTIELQDDVDIFPLRLFIAMREIYPEDIDVVHDFGEHGLFVDSRSHRSDDFRIVEVRHERR